MPVDIFVKSLTGKTITINCELTDTILSIKEKFHSIEGVPAEEQRLIFGGRQLNDADTLESYGIQADSTLFVVLRLRGGSMITLFNIMTIPIIVNDNNNETLDNKNLIEKNMFKKTNKHKLNDKSKGYRLRLRHRAQYKILND